MVGTRARRTPRLQADDGGAQSLPNRIAAQIMEFARLEGLDVGAHLREQLLADHFKVSRSPVRTALQLLQDVGIVENIPNRGFFLTRPAQELEAFPSALADADEDPLYYRIAEDRLAGVIEARFTENELMRHYDVPRSRLLRNLMQMSQEGWLERLPGHGWAFQPSLMSTQAYEQSYRFRALIEPAALLEPGYQVDARAFEQLRAEQEFMLKGGIFRCSNAETFRIGTHFHETIVACSGNRFYLDGIRSVNRLRRLFEYRVNKDRNRLAHECKDHLHILDMIQAGEREKASEHLRAHLTRAKDVKLGLAES